MSSQTDRTARLVRSVIENANASRKLKCQDDQALCQQIINTVLVHTRGTVHTVTDSDDDDAFLLRFGGVRRVDLALLEKVVICDTDRVLDLRVVFPSFWGCDVWFEDGRQAAQHRSTLEDIALPALHVLVLKSASPPRVRQHPPQPPPTPENLLSVVDGWRVLPQDVDVVKRALQVALSHAESPEVVAAWCSAPEGGRGYQMVLTGHTSLSYAFLEDLMDALWTRITDVVFEAHESGPRTVMYISRAGFPRYRLMPVKRTLSFDPGDECRPEKRLKPSS